MPEARDSLPAQPAETAAEARRAIMAFRREQRERLIAARLAVPTAAHRAATEAIGERLAAVVEALKPAVLGAYWPIRREFNPQPLLQRCLAAGAQVALPMIRVKKEPLEFRLWHPGARMQIGVYDIPYPADTAAVQPDTLLMPLVGFDGCGYRLGYGGGYYDRTVASLLPRPRLVGISYELARIPTIHPLWHDIRMDCVVTEAATAVAPDTTVAALAAIPGATRLQPAPAHIGQAPPGEPGR
jgi:5-formyltetrahydrofolate cyclo-ligase